MSLSPEAQCPTRPLSGASAGRGRHGGRAQRQAATNHADSPRPRIWQRTTHVNLIAGPLWAQRLASAFDDANRDKPSRSEVAMPEARIPIDALNAADSVLLLIDYQPHMYNGMSGRDRDGVHRAALALTTAAAILEVPTVLTALNPASNGDFRADIAAAAPGSEIIVRKVPGFDSLADQATLDAVRASGRRKLVLTGLWTSMCMSFSALHALREGFEVYGVFDGAGDMSAEAHECAVSRMTQAGVVPVTWMQVVSEWMDNWANPKSGELISKVYAEFNVTMGM
ncbi:isochorismatase family protein [Nocardia sp. NPDC051832]|uniref:isochorismatase family protein n=1 Tax=Nocardia sp. NPDC051832 TaxID=3155673 RepID=UPI00342BA390